MFNVQSQTYDGNILREASKFLINNAVLSCAIIHPSTTSNNTKNHRWYRVCLLVTNIARAYEQKS